MKLVSPNTRVYFWAFFMMCNFGFLLAGPPKMFWYEVFRALATVTCVLLFVGAVERFPEDT